VFSYGTHPGMETLMHSYSDSTRRWLHCVARRATETSVTPAALRISSLICGQCWATARAQSKPSCGPSKNLILPIQLTSPNRTCATPSAVISLHWFSLSSSIKRQCGAHMASASSVSHNSSWKSSILIVGLTLRIHVRPSEHLAVDMELSKAASPD
jgi:hypothetical protein